MANVKALSETGKALPPPAKTTTATQQPTTIPGDAIPIHDSPHIGGLVLPVAAILFAVAVWWWSRKHPIRSFWLGGAVALAVVVCVFGMLPKRSAFDLAPDVTGSLASAGISCAIAYTGLAWFSDACEGQARLLETTIGRGVLAIEMAEHQRSVPLQKAYDKMCLDDPASCKKTEVATSATGEQ